MTTKSAKPKIAYYIAKAAQALTKTPADKSNHLFANINDTPPYLSVIFEKRANGYNPTRICFFDNTPDTVVPNGFDITTSEINKPEIQVVEINPPSEMVGLTLGNEVFFNQLMNDAVNPITSFSIVFQLDKSPSDQPTKQNQPKLTFKSAVNAVIVQLHPQYTPLKIIVNDTTKYDTTRCVYIDKYNYTKPKTVNPPTFLETQDTSTHYTDPKSQSTAGGRKKYSRHKRTKHFRNKRTRTVRKSNNRNGWVW